MLEKQKQIIRTYISDEGLEVEPRKKLGVLKNDPFYPTEGGAAKALWFKSIWEKFNPSGKPVHLRRLHHQLVSQPLHNQVTTHDGKVYENRDNYLGYLIEAAKSARGFGLIDPTLIVDMRNPEPVG